MGTVDAGFAVSLDGFVADEKDDISALYAWMVGAVEQNTPLDDMELTEHGEETQQSRSTELGAIVSGRRTFDLAKGWGGPAPARRPGRRPHPRGPDRVGQRRQPLHVCDGRGQGGDRDGVGVTHLRYRVVRD